MSDSGDTNRVSHPGGQARPWQALQFGMKKGSSLGLRMSDQDLIGVGQIWGSKACQPRGRGCRQHSVKDSEVWWGQCCDPLVMSAQGRRREGTRDFWLWVRVLGESSSSNTLGYYTPVSAAYVKTCKRPSSVFRTLTSDGPGGSVTLGWRFLRHDIAWSLGFLHGYRARSEVLVWAPL